MKATNKQEFFELLGYELNRIGIDDTTEIFADFEEHFSDGFIRGIPENEIAENLGDIKEIARSYLNIESSRLNSIMAREVERKRVSLTKPGRSVPADLSLLKDGNSQNLQDILNSDNIRSYTPEHMSGEIYPEAPASSPAGGTGTSSGSSQRASSASSSGMGGNSQGAGAAAANNQTVADAFSQAGKAAVDAAKVAGHAIADAFTQNNVKSKVSEAGKTAANAVKTAGKTAAEAISKAKAEHERKHGRAPGTSAGASGASATAANSQRAAQASEFYPAGASGATGASGTTGAPGATAGASGSSASGRSKKSGKKRKPFSRFSDFKGMKVDVNSEKLVVAIVLDVFLWSWLLPVIAGILIAMFFWGLKVMFENGFGSFGNYHYYYISRLFLCTGFCSLGAIICLFTAWLIKQALKLVKFVIILHYKAVYNV